MILLAVRRAGVVALFVLLGALSAPVTVSEAGAPEATVEIVPSSVTLVPGDTVQVAVVLNNPTDTTLTVDGVDVVVPPHVTASNVSGLPWTLAPGSSRLANLDVTAGPGVAENSVAIVVKLSQGTSARRVSASLSVKPATGALMPEAAFVVFPPKLGDGDRRATTVRLTNPTASRFTNLQLLAVDSDDAYLDKPESPVSNDCTPGTGRDVLASPDELAPGASTLVDLEVRACKSVRTGTQQVSVVLMGTRVVKNGAEPVAEVLAVASHDVELTVFGVDAISPFGVGTLFLLPGLLVIAVFFSMIRWIYPRLTTGIPDKVDPRDLLLMPIIVLGGMLAYLLVWFIVGENLTRSVSTFAVGMLFTFGVFMGLAAWGLHALLYLRLVRRRFRVNSGPHDVLSTLRYRGDELNFPSFTVDDVVYLHLGTTDGKEYCSPRITHDFAPEISTNEEKKFNDAIRTNDIATILRMHKDRKVKLDWRDGAGLKVYEPALLPSSGQKMALLEQR